MVTATRAPLKLEGLSVAYGETLALDHIDLDIEFGASLALIGPNGSGKSTLLNVVAGLVGPTSGTLTPRPVPHVAYVLQHHHREHWLPLTAGEVLRMGRYRDRGLLGRLVHRDRVALAEAAERMDVAGLLHRPFDELSGGQRQRILVAQALAQQPEVLLMDEPITGLDLASQRSILDLIDAESARGTAVVITTHHLDEARHCDRVALVAGKLVAVGPPDEVLAEETLRTVFGERVLGDHAEHAHHTELLMLDDHGHDH